MMIVLRHRYDDRENISKGVQASCGSKATQPDISAIELHHLCVEYKKDLTISKEEAQQVEQDMATER